MCAELAGMNVESIMTLCEVYAAERKLTLSTVSTYAAAAGDFYARLQRGHDLTTRRAARVAQWFSDNWPDGVDWPRGIPRPASSGAGGRKRRRRAAGTATQPSGPPRRPAKRRVEFRDASSGTACPGGEHETVRTRCDGSRLSGRKRPGPGTG